MKRPRKSWKTTAAGALSFALTVVTIIWPQTAETVSKIMGAAITFGFLAARDNNRSSEDVGAK
jgi:hypothetical protein